MDISSLIKPDRIACDAAVTSKKKALEQLSKLIAASSPNLTPEEIFDSLLDRERLGSTGLGHGVALPHGRLHGREHAIGAFIKLKQGIEYDAIDNEPVDLLYALLVPEHFTEDHLKIISELAEIFNDDKFRLQLRKCDDPNQIYQQFTSAFSRSAASESLASHE